MVRISDYQKKAADKSYVIKNRCGAADITRVLKFQDWTALDKPNVTRYHDQGEIRNAQVGSSILAGSSKNLGVFLVTVPVGFLFQYFEHKITTGTITGKVFVHLATGRLFVTSGYNPARV